MPNLKGKTFCLKCIATQLLTWLLHINCHWSCWWILLVLNFQLKFQFNMFYDFDLYPSMINLAEDPGRKLVQREKRITMLKVMTNDVALLNLKNVPSHICTISIIASYCFVLCILASHCCVICIMVSSHFDAISISYIFGSHND